MSAQQSIPWEQQALHIAIDTLQEALSGKPKEQQEALHMSLMTLRGFLAAQNSVDEEFPVAPIQTSSAIDASRSNKFKQLLYERRTMAGLSQARLAELAGLAESAIANIESGRALPTQLALLHLLSVPELKLEVSDLPWEVAESDPNFALNCWLAPGFDPVKMIKELSMQVNSFGGHIEQGFLYMDPMSAADWCAIADLKDYDEMQASMQLDRAASVILEQCGKMGLDVVALGPGSARNEVRLVEQILAQGGHGDVRLYLLDISQPLLSVAYRHAAETLADRGGVVFAIQGNFHHLPRYGQLLYSPQRAHRRRLVTMLGHTFSNLENELRFVRNSLVGFGAGDLLLLDIRLAYASTDRPADEIIEKDPGLLKARGRGVSSALRQRWDEFLTGPIRRYAHVQTEIDMLRVLDLSCPIPGSYAVDARARVRLPSGEEREFSVYYSRRYDSTKLQAALSREGWETVANWAYGGEVNPCMLFLLRKSGPALRLVE
ncbi:MAG: L-histidine N(alpha)-methyltransferase [Polyangia bacterium]|jgi:transcriptional regulator with XRE-family HTH domain